MRQAPGVGLSQVLRAQGKWLAEMDCGAELYRGLLEALTLTCGVVNWS